MELNILQSFLQARDPSIQSYNRTNLKEVRANLNDLMCTTITDTDENEEEKFINVYLRIRGDMEMHRIYKTNGNCLICTVPDGSYSSRNIKASDSMKRTYSFTKIFGPECNQQMIFNNIIKPKLLTFINGRNSTLFAYGASSSGKTFTVVGTPQEPGIIPRSLEYIFRSLPKISQYPEIKPLPNGRTITMSRRMMEEEVEYKNNIINFTLIDQAAHIKTYKQMQERLSSEPCANVDDISDVSISVWVSFTEIYNETLYDLLSLPSAINQPRPKLALGITDNDNTYIKKSIHVNIKNGLEGYQVLQYGLHRLNYASTAVNAHSSRSHCIFTVKLVQSSKYSNHAYVSNFNFCDLAGSERLKKTMNFGDRLKESNNINTSLLVLGRCIETIRKCQQVRDRRLIPFRESKLTRIFQKALLGNENVEMIVNINPSREMFDESIHVLNFSAIAKNIIVAEEKLKPIVKENRFSLMMQEENARLKLNYDLKDVQRNYSAEERIRKLERENRRLKEKLHQTLDLDKDTEIERLRNAIEKLCDERDELIANFEETIKKEKQFVANTYKGILDRTEERYKKSNENALARLREVYQQKIASMEVIMISSSDDESSPQKRSPHTKSRVYLEEKILHFENLVDEQLNKIKKKEDIIAEQERSLKDKISLLDDAKEQYRLLKAQSERYCELYNQQKSENLALQEEVELLKSQMCAMSIVKSDSDDSDEDDDHKLSSGGDIPSYVIDMSRPSLKMETHYDVSGQVEKINGAFLKTKLSSTVSTVNRDSDDSDKDDDHKLSSGGDIPFCVTEMSRQSLQVKEHLEVPGQVEKNKSF